MLFGFIVALPAHKSAYWLNNHSVKVSTRTREAQKKAADLLLKMKGEKSE
jgi:hypothetical protein